MSAKKMTIYQKLNEARIKLQSIQLKKSGHNKFSNYQYFELGDFLPTINVILNDVGICGVVSFDKETATLTLTDVEDSSTIVITSPMGSANLKGCHEVQNIGAVETYQRRYLWVTALEIIEHDALDAVTGNEKTVDPVKKIITPESGQAWTNAKAAFKRDGNLDAVLARVNISEEDKVKLYAECDSV